MRIHQYLISIILGYLIGSINPAYIIGKIRGVDIREKGTHNAGATNTLLVFGKARGVFVLAFDSAKMYFSLSFFKYLFPNAGFICITTGIAVLIGHCYPFYMNFSGGKGLAAYFGMIIYSCPKFIIATAFCVYVVSSLFMMYFDKRKYINVVGPFIGTFYFLFFAINRELQIAGVLGGILLVIGNYLKTSRHPELDENNIWESIDIEEK